MAELPDQITIGQLAARSGIAASALRFYEAEGLIHAARSSGGQRRYGRATLRRVALIRAARRVGVPLGEIADALATLPTERTPTKADWTRLSRRWQRRLDREIAALEALRDDLTSCIGCGCLSLKTCRLQNPGDKAALDGTGPRYLTGATDDREDARTQG